MDLKILAKYPFLDEAKDYVSSLNLSMDEMQKHPIYSSSFKLGKQRVLDAINGKIIEEIDNKYPELSIMSYAFARLLVNLNRNRFLKRVYATSEAERVYNYLKNENSDIVEKVTKDVGLNIVDNKVPLVDYLGLTSSLSIHEPRWKLINRSLDGGKVIIDKTEIPLLLREAIRLRVMGPVATKGVPNEFVEIAKNIHTGMAGPTSMKLDQVEENALPRCISNMLSMLESGDATHNVMFILGTFFVNLGLNTEDIVKIFSKSPKFDEKTTRYQLRFLTGERGRTKYSAPSCSKIRSYGLCDIDCKVKHPVSYYRNQLRKRRFKIRKTDVKKVKKANNK